MSNVTRSRIPNPGGSKSRVRPASISNGGGSVSRATPSPESGGLRRSNNTPTPSSKRARTLLNNSGNMADVFQSVTPHVYDLTILVYLD